MKKIILLVLLANFFLVAQTQMQNLISRVNSIPDQATKNAVIDSFMTANSTRGFPFIENNNANFIYRGTATTVSVAGDFNSWSQTAMTNLAQTNFYFHTRQFEMNARLDYKFVINGSNWILDPLNPIQVAGGFGPNSELAMPLYIQPWEIQTRQNVQRGTVEERTFRSSNTGATYQLRIYLPPQYHQQQTRRFPTAYFQDGFEYVDLARATTVIDNLIDSNKIDPIVGVFVRPTNRNEEYAGATRVAYRLFFVNELVPFIDSVYRTMKAADKRLVLGDSFGGNISALISFNHPEIFANCGLHSGAFWPNNFEIYNQIINSPRKNIKFVSVWGTYESLFSNMRNFRDTLTAKGYSHRWLELPEGHSWGLWRATTDFILEFIFPFGSTSVKNEIDSEPDFKLSQNYPNPFNPTTTISWQLPNDSYVSLVVYDMLGNEVVTLVNEEKKSGNYNIEFNAHDIASGIYFYKLTANKISGGKLGSFSETKKIILLK